ncbi:MAG TPA: hypothetical protein VD790_01225 [Thermoleophilaceae bacterium]|nr:hypothetical protein [Thermoleophilaceae bacterium]
MSEEERTEDGAAAKAQAAEEEQDEAKEEMEQLEEDPPEKLEDWPDGKAKYETFGGPEGEHSYEEGPEQKLGQSGVRHHDDGSVSVDGEKVDNPDDYKGDPIPGGPTDPNSPELAGEKDENEGDTEDTSEGGTDDESEGGS